MVTSPYAAQTWANDPTGGTPISAARLAHMEAGILAASTAFNAVDFGVVGDGVADDTAALQAAVAAAAGATLFIPSGTYLLTGALSVLTGTTVVGVPGSTVLKVKTGSTSNPMLLSISNRTDVTVVGVTFDGNQANVTSTNNVVTVFQSSRVIFDLCTWRNTRGIGVIFSTSIVDSGVKRSYFSEVGSYNKVSGLSADRKQAIAYSSGTKANNVGNFAIDNVFSEVGLDCVSCTNQNDFLILGNRLLSNYSGGFYVSTSSNVRVVGNYATGGSASGNGVDVNASTEVSVTGNTIAGRGGGGIMLADCTNCSVVGNVSINNWQSGSSAHQGGVTLAGSTGCSNVTVAGNVCTDTQVTKTQQYGVHVTAIAHTLIWIDDSNLLSGNVVGNIGPQIPNLTTRTPTWTSFTTGNGTVAVGASSSKDHVDEHGTFTLGSTSAITGSLFLGMPVAAHATYQPNNSIVGTFSVYDTSAALWKHGLLVKSGTAAKLVLYDGTPVTNANPAWAGGWAAGDQIHWHLDYIPA